MVEKILDDLIKSGLAVNQYDWNVGREPHALYKIITRQTSRGHVYVLLPRDYAEELAAGLEYIYGAGVAVIPPSAAEIPLTEE